MATTRTDEFGVPIVTTGGSRTSNFGIGLPTYAAPTLSPDINNPLRTGGMGVAGTRLSDPYAFDTFPGDVGDTAATGLPGSPMSTLYGVDSESYLTDDQRKLARQIQGKFDQSVGFRDRELQRYGAPRLASFTEDESLARAMSLARGLNFPEKADDMTPTGLVRQGRPVTTPRPPGAVPPPPPSVPRDRYAEWAKVMSGLMSIGGLLFGRNAYGEFINKGAIKSVMDWYKQITGTDAASPEHMQQIIGGGGESPAYPTQAATDWWNQNSSPWGASAEGGGAYPTQTASDWWNVPGGESAITTPLAPEIPVTPDITDIPWWEM